MTTARGLAGARGELRVLLAVYDTEPGSPSEPGPLRFVAGLGVATPLVGRVVGIEKAPADLAADLRHFFDSAR